MDQTSSSQLLLFLLFTFTSPPSPCVHSIRNIPLKCYSTSSSSLFNSISILPNPHHLNLIFITVNLPQLSPPLLLPLTAHHNVRETGLHVQQCVVKRVSTGDDTIPTPTAATATRHQGGEGGRRRGAQSGDI